MFCTVCSYVDVDVHVHVSCLCRCITIHQCLRCAPFPFRVTLPSPSLLHLPRPPIPLPLLLSSLLISVVDIVFSEVFDHMNELMTDPFGNYLCQKLIEHCNDQQRLTIITKVAPDLVAISLNMHGTRAVQKLVETISTPKEVELVVNALRTSVVTLIKDLNGNHVIQRCLHHLTSKDNQFIYDSVVRHCVSVATHKHGCCVLQR